MYCVDPVIATEDVPVEVTSTCWPLLTVVTTVTNCWSEVETNWLVRTMGVVRGAEETGGRLDTGPTALLGGGLEPWRLEGAGVDCAGGSEDSGSGVGSGVGVGCGVGVGWREEGGGAGVEEAGGGVGELLLPPVPDACLFSPWCQYSTTPMPSPRLKADDRATSA